MNKREWDMVSTKFIDLTVEINKKLGRKISFVLMAHDERDGTGSVCHSCDPELAEAMIHDAFDNYDADKVDEFLKEEDEEKPRS